MYRTLFATCGAEEWFLFLYHFPFRLATRCKQRAVHCIFAGLLLYDNLAATTSGMLDEADLRVNLLADLRSMADHAYLAALGGL